MGALEGDVDEQLQRFRILNAANNVANSVHDVHNAPNNIPTSSTSPRQRKGVPSLGPFEGLTWAPIGSARDLGDRSERGSQRRPPLLTPLDSRSCTLPSTASASASLKANLSLRHPRLSKPRATLLLHHLSRAQHHPSLRQPTQPLQTPVKLTSCIDRHLLWRLFQGGLPLMLDVSHVCVFVGGVCGGGYGIDSCMYNFEYRMCKEIFL